MGNTQNTAAEQDAGSKPRLSNGLANRAVQFNATLHISTITFTEDQLRNLISSYHAQVSANAQFWTIALLSLVVLSSFTAEAVEHGFHHLVVNAAHSCRVIASLFAAAGRLFIIARRPRGPSNPEEFLACSLGKAPLPAKASLWESLLSLVGRVGLTSTEVVPAQTHEIGLAPSGKEI